MRKHVLIMGGFLKAHSLAASLLHKGYRVTAVNRSYKDSQTLSAIQGLKVIYGDATKTFVLEDAFADEADIAIALTQRDEENLVMCELCKQKFRVKKTVALINDPKKTEFFRKMGVDSVVCAINAITNIIEQQAIMEEMTRMTAVGEGKINILEVPVPNASPAAGKKVWELELPDEVVLGCIIRDEKSVIPKGDTKILGGDTIVLITSAEKKQKAVRLLTGRKTG